MGFQQKANYCVQEEQHNINVKEIKAVKLALLPYYRQFQMINVHFLISSEIHEPGSEFTKVNSEQKLIPQIVQRICRMKWMQCNKVGPISAFMIPHLFQ